MPVAICLSYPLAHIYLSNSAADVIMPALTIFLDTEYESSPEDTTTSFSSVLMLTCPEEAEAGVGVTSGTAVGVGAFVGVGAAVGVGVAVGAFVGAVVGVLVGAFVGAVAGVLVAAIVGVGVVVTADSDCVGVVIPASAGS